MAGNSNYTLMLQAQINTAALRESLKAFENSYVMQLNAAIKSAQQAVGTTSGSSPGSGGTEAPTTNAEKLNAAWTKLNSTGANYVKTSQTMDVATGQVTKAMGLQQLTATEAEKTTVKVNKSTGELRGEIVRTTDATKSWISSLGNAYQKILLWAVATGTLYGALKMLKDGIQYIKDLNIEMTNIQQLGIDGAQTGKQISALATDFNQLAQAMGSSTIEIANVSADFLRQGFTIEQSQKLVQSALELSKLGNLDLAQSTDNLIATMNGFGMSAEEVENSVSKLIAIDNVAATSAGELATGLQYVSAVAKQTGVDFDQITAMIATASSRTRLSAEMIGTAFRTMLIRMSQVKAGVSTDDFGEDLNNVEKVLRNFGLELRDETTNVFKPFGDVINEIAANWKNWDTVQQSQIATAIAGQRQAQIFLTTLNNYGDVQKYIATETESAGLAQQRYQIYLQGVEAAMNRSKTAWEGFWQVTTRSDSVKWFYNLSAGIGNFATKIGGLFPILSGILGLIIAFKGPEVVGGFVTLGDKVSSVLGAWGSKTTALTAAKANLVVVQAAQIASTEALAVAEAGNVLALGAEGPITESLVGAKAALVVADEALIVAENGVTAASVAAKAAMAATVIGIIAIVGSGLWMAWNSFHKSTAQALDDINKKIAEYESGLDSLKSGADQLSSIADEYEKLRIKAESLGGAEKLTNDEHERFIELQNQIHGILPGVSGQYDSMGNYVFDLGIDIQTLTGLIQDQVTAMQDLRRETILSGMEVKAEDFAKKQREQEKLNDLVEKYNQDIARAAYYDEPGMETGDWQDKQSKAMDKARIKSEEVTNSLVELRASYMILELSQRDAFVSTLRLAGVTEEAIAKIIEETAAIEGTVPAVVDASAALKTLTDAADKSSEAFMKNDAMLQQVSESMEKNGQISVEQANQMIEAGYATALMIDVKTGKIAVNVAILHDLVVANAQAAAAEAKLAYDSSVTTKALPSETKALWAKWQVLAAIAKLVGEKPTAFSIPTIPTVGGGGGGQSAADKLNAELKKQKDDEKKQLNEQLKDYKELKDAEKDYLKDQLDSYKKIIDARKEVLQSLKAEQDYKISLGEKEKDVSSTKREILELSLDNSREATARRLKLEEELLKKQADLDELQRDKSYQDQIKALEKEEKTYEDFINAQIDVLDSEYKLYENFINTQIGMIDNFLSNLEDIISRMANSLGGSVSSSSSGASTGSGSKISSSVPKIGTSGKLVQMRASGIEAGLIGGEEPDKFLTLLSKGEGVFNTGQMKNLLNNIVKLPSMPQFSSVNGSPKVDISMPISVSGNLDRTILPDLEKMVNKVVGKLNDNLASRGYIRRADMYSAG